MSVKHDHHHDGRPEPHLDRSWQYTLTIVGSATILSGAILSLTWANRVTFLHLTQHELERDTYIIDNQHRIMDALGIQRSDSWPTKQKE